MRRKFALPAKYKFIDRYFGQQEFVLLDIGAGNHSASKTVSWFPNCKYHGVDLDKNYNNDEHDFKVMQAFYELNLEQLKFDEIPNGHFDFIMMAHVIEHLKNGDEVLRALLPKLKPGGMIYVEFPGLRSTKLPRMKGTLNFFDDDTHVRIYSVAELVNVFLKENCTVLHYGTRRHWPNLVMMPFKVPHNLIKYGKIIPSIFWDALGFAEYVIVKKN